QEALKAAAVDRGIIPQLPPELGKVIAAIGPALTVDKILSSAPVAVQIAAAPLFLGTGVAKAAAGVVSDVGSFIGGLFGGPAAPSPTYYAGPTSGGGGSGSRGRMLA